MYPDLYAIGIHRRSVAQTAQREMLRPRPPAPWAQTAVARSGTIAAAPALLSAAPPRR